MTYVGAIKEVHSIAEVRGEEGNVVLIRVKIDDPSKLVTPPRPGATVQAQIYCGRLEPRLSNVPRSDRLVAIQGNVPILLEY